MSSTKFILKNCETELEDEEEEEEVEKEEANEIAQLMKSDDLDLTPRTCRMEGENLLLHVVL